MNSLKEANSPLSSYNYSKTIVAEDDEIQSNFNFSVCSEPVNRKKRQESIISQGRKNSLTTNEPITFKNEKEWKNTPYCGICTMVFDKLKGVFTHHCRICGISACGECSNKKINGSRVCDLCFLRLESQELIEKREKLIEMKEATLFDMERNIAEMNGKNNQCHKEITEVVSAMKQNDDKHRLKMEEMKNELKDIAGILKKKKENQLNFEQNLRNEEMMERSKQTELDRLRKEIGKLKEENLRKKFSLAHSKEELMEMMQHIKKTQTSQSYLDLTEVFDISKEDLQRTFTGIEFHARNDRSMLENYELDVPHLLKKTISYQKRTYTSHSLMKSKLISRTESHGVELENEEKTGIDIEQKPPSQNGNCFGSACKIF